MVKAVVGEESRLQLAEDRLAQSAVPAQVGLVIGKLSSKLDRGFIFDLVPTPPNDAGEPPCSIIEPVKEDNKKKGSSKPKSTADSSSLFIDKDWVAEHARQVARMLVGGIKVVGIYVWVGETAFKNSTLILCQTVKGVADAAPLSESGWDERLLVHISYSPRRWTCRNCSLASNITSSSLRPCDFKMGRVLNSIQTFKCMYSFDIRLPIYRENLLDGKTLNDVLQDGISFHAKELRGAKALVDGNLVDVIEDEPSTSDDVHEVELLLPLLNDASLGASSQKEIGGILVYSGCVCSYAYLYSKEPVSQALTDIKEDIITSLRSRLDIISDEAEREAAAAAEDDMEINNKISAYQTIIQPLRKQCILPFPRRVFIPWHAGIYACDYLLPSESFEALKDHFVELLAMEAPKDDSTLVEVEKEILSLTAKSFWDVTTPSYQASVTSKGRNGTVKADAKKSSTGMNFNGMFAGIVLLISILLGLLLFSSSSG
uniref:Protein odr-4 homolog n=1 Tax=Opuntia streptacantha TaxID=393608 RepID=A0A7C9B2I6_OPUST